MKDLEKITIDQMLTALAEIKYMNSTGKEIVKLIYAHLSDLSNDEIKDLFFNEVLKGKQL
tara:strand:+ start:2130 stop:2309 length:180 start_codon:yes stop_codon:yes gene_type:complete